MSEESNSKKNNDKFRSLLNDASDIAESVIFSMFLVLLVFTYLCGISDVSGPSMEPSLYENERVLVSRLLYKAEHNDIVVVDSSALRTMIVKRIIGLPGDSVDIDFEKGIVSVNGIPVDEQLYEKCEDGSEPELTADHFVNTLTTVNMGAFDNYPIEIPEGYIFVLGDNRNRSKDSKHLELGFVPMEEIEGEVFFRIYPFSRFGFVK